MPAAAVKVESPGVDGKRAPPTRRPTGPEFATHKSIRWAKIPISAMSGCEKGFSHQHRILKPASKRGYGLAGRLVLATPGQAAPNAEASPMVTPPLPLMSISAARRSPFHSAPNAEASPIVVLPSWLMSSG